MNKKVISIAFCIILCIMVAGCSKAPKITNPKLTPKKQTGVSKETNGKAKVLMMGRSVMGNWFRTWNGNPDEPYVKNGYVFYYKELMSPPDIVQSAKDYLNEADKDTIVFFKFCFDDFAGSSREEAKTSLKEKKDYLTELYEEVVEKKGLVMITATALPKVAKYTDEDLVWNHRQYNQWIKSFTEEHENIFIFDMYNILSDNEGNLKAQYSADEEDSHPIDTTAEEFDNRFLPILDEASS